jgi:chemotaxis protein CheX
MKAEYINPFITSLTNTFKTMLSCDVQRGEMYLHDGRNVQHEISGVIGLSGEAVGTVVVSLSKGVALQAASAMLMCEASEINDEVVDVVGELANMVAGAAKAKLEELSLSISLPSVITGSNHEVRFPSSVQPICIPFDSPWGPLMLSVGLAPSPVHV